MCPVLAQDNDKRPSVGNSTSTPIGCNRQRLLLLVVAVAVAVAVKVNDPVNDHDYEERTPNRDRPYSPLGATKMLNDLVPEANSLKLAPTSMRPIISVRLPGAILITRWLRASKIM